MVVHAMERAQRLRERVYAVYFGVSVGADDHDLLAANVPCHLLEERQRWPVAPVQVIEEDDERTSAVMRS